MVLLCLGGERATRERQRLREGEGCAGRLEQKGEEKGKRVVDDHYTRVVFAQLCG